MAIHYVGNKPDNSHSIFYQHSTFDEFVEWESNQLAWQFDLESNVTKSIVDRKMKLMQFGDLNGTIQWVINPRQITSAQADKLLDITRNPLKQKLIHNVSFECSLMKKYGVQLENVYDTMLVDKILWCGYVVPKGFYSLKELTERYLFKTRDKGLQTSFDVEWFTPEQIQYAADDVIDLGHIKRLQHTQLKLANLEYVAALENDVVQAFTDIEYNGTNLNLDAWRANIALADPIINEAKIRLDDFVRGEELKSKSIELGFLTDKESININWNSPKIKRELFSILYPDLKGATQPIIKKYLKEYENLQDKTSSSLTENGADCLARSLTKDYTGLNQWLESTQRDYLLQNSFLVESGKVLISWTSPQQKLALFQVIEPALKSVGEPVLSEYEHPMFDAYFEWLKANTLKTKYGEKFIENHVESDGKVRTHFNQIVSTGRSSSSNYNQQNIPSGENVGTRYRNCFTSDPGWVVCSSDFSSQELTLIAYFSGEKSWLDALANNYDIHSVCGEQVFKSKWREGAEKDCKYYKVVDGKQLKLKCNCKTHKTQRIKVKTISYAISYGATKYRISSVVKISLDDAQELIDDYFRAFPGIRKLLDGFANYGIKHGYIKTAKPFNRIRYFDYWDGNQDNKWLMDKIGRASSNMPLQGSSGDQMKVAMYLVYTYIKDNNLGNSVKIVANIHDEMVCHVKDGYAEEWKAIMKSLMEEATTLTLPVGMLKADTDLSGNMWSK